MNNESSQNVIEVNGDNVVNKKFNPIFIIIAILFVVFIILVIIIFNIFNKSTEEKLLDRIFDQNYLIKLYENGRYGFINDKGESIIEPKYEYAMDFIGEHTVICENTDYVEDNKCMIIDKKGNVELLFDDYSNFQYIEFYDYWIIDEVLYNEKLKAVTDEDESVIYLGGEYLAKEKNEEYSIINIDGKKAFELERGEEIDEFMVSWSTEDLKDTYCAIEYEDSFRIVNCKNGKEIYEGPEAYISDMGNNIFEINYNDSDKAETIYVEDNELKVIIDSTVDDVYYYDNYIKFIINDSWSDEEVLYYDLKEEELTEENLPNKLDVKYTDYDKYTYYEDYNLEIIQTDDDDYKLFYKNKRVTDEVYEEIEFLDIQTYKYLLSKNKNYILVETEDEKTQLINVRNGKVEFELDSTYYSQNGLFVYNHTFNNENSLVIYNMLTEESITLSNEHSVDDYGSNYIIVEENDTTYYYNNEFELIYTVK